MVSLVITLGNIWDIQRYINIDIQITNFHDFYHWLMDFKGALLGPRQILAIERPLKNMKNAFYLT